MARGKNLFVRAFDAVIAGRERHARDFVERYEREYGKALTKFTKR